LYIDFSRYKCFTENPERYRLIYEQNLHPKAMPYGLARGTAFHRIAELMEILKKDKDAYPVTFGRDIDRALIEEGIEAEARDNAWRMYHAHQSYVNNPHPPKILEMEREWSLPLDDPKVPANEMRSAIIPTASGHHLCGRVDQIIESDAGRFVLDTKTAHAKTQLARTKKDWLTNKQADFLLIGAKALGYNVKCLIIHVILETTPPRIWEITVTRTAAQLEQLKRSALLTCSIIEHLRSTFGIDDPWPHLDAQWPCNTADRCDYRSICGQHIEYPMDLVDFKERKEHLALLRPKQETK